jgi:hypothetical protein
MAKKSLEQRLQRIEDINRIKNLMSKLEFLHAAGREEEAMQLFALDTPGVSAEVGNWGVYEGREGIERISLGVHKNDGADARGFMVMHTLCAPVIQVAGDGKTAKAVWMSPGHETMIRNGKLDAGWAWLKYGVDFIKENGTWKIWHSHVYGLFMVPYKKSWVESTDQAELIDITGRMPAKFKGTRPPSHPLWTYSTTAVPEYIPVPPEPYETFDDKTRY